jgi:hypothetical protein
MQKIGAITAGATIAINIPTLSISPLATMEIVDVIKIDKITDAPVKAAVPPNTPTFCKNKRNIIFYNPSQLIVIKFPISKSIL